MVRQKTAWYILIVVFIVILAGGIVRTTQSGMGCPDWPKCFGQWIPPMSKADLPANYQTYLKKQTIDTEFNALHTWIEYLNRWLGLILGMLAVWQCVLAWRTKKLDEKYFRRSLLVLALVIVTGLVGALVVKFHLAHLSISIHLALALAISFAQLYVLVGLQQLPPIILPTAFKNLFYITIGISIAQFILGTIVRMYIDDVSEQLAYQQREFWLSNTPLVFLIHRTSSWLALGSGLYVAHKLFYNFKLPKPALVIIASLLCSFMAGIILYKLSMPAIAQPVHLICAAVLLSAYVYAWFRVKNS
jgi:heme a synthase